MGDVADILGFGPKVAVDDASKLLAGDKPKVVSQKIKKPKGMSREVFGLLGPDSLISALPTTKLPTASAAFKTKRASALRGKWVWAPFNKDSSSSSSSSAETGCLHHWVKADVQYTEYPYVKFDVKLERVTYTDEEYDHILQSDLWTRSETDRLFALCYRYDLRWPVIVDRYDLQPPRCAEELQQRFYSVLSSLRLLRSGNSNQTSNPKAGEPSTTFVEEHEKARRIQQELLFRRCVC